jgi:hypothetical protein
MITSTPRSAAWRLAHAVNLLDEEDTGGVRALDQFSRIAELERDDRRPGGEREREQFLVERARGVIDDEGPLGQLADLS